MRSQAFAEATLALFGLCVCLAPLEARAQSVPTTAVPASAQAQLIESLPEPTVATSKPGVRMVRQPLPGGAVTQSPAAFKEPARKKQSWMDRHKVLTTIIFAVLSVFAGGAER